MYKYTWKIIFSYIDLIYQIESVDLALKLLDDSNFKGKTIKVEKVTYLKLDVLDTKRANIRKTNVNIFWLFTFQAHFEMKGAFDASLKPKKKKKKKNKKGKGQDK